MGLVSIWFPERQNKRQLLGLQANWCPILWRLTKGGPSSLPHPSSGQHLSVSDPKTVSYLSLQYLRLPVCHVQGKRVTPNLCHCLLWSTPSQHQLSQYIMLDNIIVTMLVTFRLKGAK